MESVFKYNFYKDYINNVIKSKSSPRGIQSAIARHIGCQASYLYQVLKGKSELTDDQAFKFTTFMKMNYEEQNYFFSIYRLSKASTPELKKYLQNEIDKKLKDHLDLKNRTNADLALDEDKLWKYYFSSLSPSLIHILTSSQKYQTVSTLSQRTLLSEDEINFHLKKLEQFGLVVSKDNKWIYNNSSVHFDNKSEYNNQIQKSRRIQSLFKIDYPKKDNQIHFSTLFTIDQKDLETLKEIISNFVQNTHEVIHNSGSDEAYIINVDLFSP